MKTNSILSFLAFMLFQISFGQSFAAKLIKGEIAADSIAVEAVTVVNNTTQNTTISDSNGMFTIEIHEGDLLVFSAVNLEPLKRRITKSDLLLSVLKIKMKPQSVVLDEVVVNDKTNISAESLGIIPYGQKKYTAAERKVFTATSTPGDALLNAISGRTKMLKKEVEIEKKEGYFYKMEYLFEEEYYTKRLNIPKDYIKGFQYYCIEDPAFIRTLETKNKNMSMFLITGLAAKYLKIIENEK